MLQYIYKKHKKLNLFKLLVKKSFILHFKKKFLLRAYVLGTDDLFFLDNSVTFFILNRSSLEDYFLLYKDNYFLAKALKLDTFCYTKTNYFNFEYLHLNTINSFFFTYLKQLFLSQNVISTSISYFSPLFFFRLGKLTAIINGLNLPLTQSFYTDLVDTYTNLNTLILSEKLKDIKVLLLSLKKKFLVTILLESINLNKNFVIKKYKNQYKVVNLLKN